MSNTAQTHVECIGLCGIARERVDLYGHRANHAERISLCWTLRKRTLNALGRNYATQGKSLACPRGRQRGKIAFARSLRNSRSPLHVPMPLPQKGVALVRYRLRRAPKEASRNRYRTSAK